MTRAPSPGASRRELDWRIRLTVRPFYSGLVGSENLLGSIGYDWRIVDGGSDQHRLLYFYRWLNEDVLGPVSLPIRLSLGWERSETHWRLAPVRLEVGAKVPIERLQTTLHLTYAPSFRLASRGFEQGWNHELAAFLDIVPLTKVLASAP